MAVPERRAKTGDRPPCVVGAGWAFLDTLVQLPAYPAEDTKTPAPRAIYDVGGPVPRALLAISRMEATARLGLVARIGTDALGDLVMHRIEQFGVELLTPRAPDVPTRASTAWLVRGTGSRTVTFDASPDADHEFPASARSMLSSPRDILHLDCRDVHVAAAACARARETGSRIVMDVGSFKPSAAHLLEFADTIISPISTLAALTGGSRMDDPVEASRKLLSNRCRRVFMTAGKDQVLAVSATETHMMKPFVVPTVDSNGAGDVFSAGVIVGLLKEMSLGETLEIAAAAAALKCTVVGNENLPTLNRILDFLSTRDGYQEVNPRAQGQGK